MLLLASVLPIILLLIVSLHCAVSYFESPFLLFVATLMLLAYLLLLSATFLLFFALLLLLA